MAQGKILVKPVFSTTHGMSSLTDLYCHKRKGYRKESFIFCSKFFLIGFVILLTILNINDQCSSPHRNQSMFVLVVKIHHYCLIVWGLFLL